MREYKIVVLGAGGVGKSALTVQYVQGVYLDQYDPTIEDSYRRTTTIDNRHCTLEILDTAGVEQFTAMRELYIKSGEGFALVYAINDRKSLDQLQALREQVVRIKGNSNVPMVLVGNKCDLDSSRTVSPSDGVAVAGSWGKVPFYETSAKTRANVNEIFVDVVRQVMRRDSSFASSISSSSRGHSQGWSLDTAASNASSCHTTVHHTLNAKKSKRLLKARASASASASAKSRAKDKPSMANLRAMVTHSARTDKKDSRPCVLM